MSATSPREADECPQCGGLLSPWLPRGLCSQCAMRGALALPDPEAVGAAAGAGSGGGLRFGHYELLSEIAHGGMGVVWKARQVDLDRVVAVKMILAGRFATPEEVARFRMEAGAAARLRHPHIVAVHEIGEVDGQHFFSMEYVAGRTLADLLRDEGPMPARAAARCVMLLARAVQHAHDQGILHRDLKPANVLLDAEGEPRITDFGLAKWLDADPALTAPGQVLGSPNYSPPEQLDGRNGGPSPASDVYSLGAILYHLLTGRPPFAAAQLADTLRQALGEEPLAPRVLDPGVPRDLEAVCMKCLQKDAQRRYTSARGLAEDLARFLAGDRVSVRPEGPGVRLVRWGRRNRLGAAFIVLLTLAVGITGVLLERLRRESEKDRRQIQVIRERLLTNIEDMWGRAEQGSELIRAEELAALMNQPGSEWAFGTVAERYAVGAAVSASPITQAQRYAPFLVRLERRLGERLGRPVVFDLRLLKYSSIEPGVPAAGDLALRRMGALSYVLLRERGDNVRVLARDDRPKGCAIFARRGEGIARLSDLAGRSFAFGKSHSTISGLAKVELVRAGITGSRLSAWRHFDDRKAYLERLHRVGLRRAMAERTHGHAAVIAAVRRGEFDAGVARREFVRDFAGSELVILHEFDAPANVWVGAGGLPAEMVHPLQAALVGAESVPLPEAGDGRVLLRLVPATEEHFEPLRRAFADEIRRFEGDRPVRADEIGEDE